MAGLWAACERDEVREKTHCWTDWRRCVTEVTSVGGKAPRRHPAFIALAYPSSIPFLPLFPAFLVLVFVESQAIIFLSFIR